MMKTLLHSLFVMMVVISSFAWVPNSLAAGTGGEFEPFQGHGGCRAQHEGVFLAVVVPCLRETVADATQRFVTEFGRFVEPMMWSFATLVVTLNGVRILTGEGDPKKQTFFLLLKIGAVAMMIRGFGVEEGIGARAVFDIIQDASEIVTASLNGSLDQMMCDRTRFQGEEPWRSMDCILGDLMGYSPNILISTSVFGMMGAALVSGSFGMMLAMGGVTIILLVIKLIWRAVYTYLMALMVCGFLIIISPVLIPLVFLGVTFQYFEHWLKSLMSTMVQPLIVLGYLTLCFAVLDMILYEPTHGIMNILSPEQIEQGYQAGQKTAGGSLHRNDFNWWRDMGVDPEQYCRTNTSQQVLSASHCLQKRQEISRIDWDMGAQHESLANRAIVAMAVAGIVAYLLTEMLDHLMTIAQSMLGGGIALAKAVDQQSQRDKEAMGKIKQGLQRGWEQNAGKKMEQAGRGGILSMFNGAAGAAGAVPNSMVNAISSLVGTRR